MRWAWESFHLTEMTCCCLRQTCFSFCRPVAALYKPEGGFAGLGSNLLFCPAATGHIYIYICRISKIFKTQVRHQPRLCVMKSSESSLQGYENRPCLVHLRVAEVCSSLLPQENIRPDIANRKRFCVVDPLCPIAIDAPFRASGSRK